MQKWQKPYGTGNKAGRVTHNCIQLRATSGSMPCDLFKKLTELLFKSNYFLDFSILVTKLYRI